MEKEKQTNDESDFGCSELLSVPRELLQELLENSYEYGGHISWYKYEKRGNHQKIYADLEAGIERAEKILSDNEKAH